MTRAERRAQQRKLKIEKTPIRLRPDSWEAARELGRAEGRAEVYAERLAAFVLIALQARGIAVPDVARERILAQKDLERLEHWLKKAAVAESVGEVIDESS